MLKQEFAHERCHTRGAIAASSAFASLLQQTYTEANRLIVGIGTWRGEQDFAVGLCVVTESNRFVHMGASSATSTEHFGGGVAVGFQWK